MTTPTYRRLLHSFVLAAMSLLIVGNASAQTTAARPDRGVSPGGSYSVSDIENINLQNGGVNLSIPLASLPPIAGGKLSLTINANYNTKLWNNTRSEQEGSGLPYRTYVVDTPQLSDVGGWSIGGTYAIFARDAREDFDYHSPPTPDPNDGYAMAEWQRLQHNWYKMVLRTPDGAEHELKPSGGNYEMYGGGGYPRTYLWSYYKDSPDNTSMPMRYNSSDGTYLSAIVNPTNHASGIQWTIFLPDGTQVINYSNGNQRIRDNNGNSIKIFSDGNGTHYQDEQTGREIRTTYDPQGAGGYGQFKVWYPTVGGGTQHIDINYGQTIVQGKIYDVQDWNPNVYDEQGNLGRECTRRQQLLPQTLTVVREIAFPATELGDPRHFSFKYDSDSQDNETATTQGVFWTCGGSTQTYTRTASHGLGAVSEITTPSGAVVNYFYTQAGVHDFIGLTTRDYIAKETLTTKVLHHDGATDTWGYTIPNESNSAVSAVNNPDGSSVTQNYFPTDPNFPRSIGDGYAGRNGLVYSTSNGLTQTLRHWTGGSQMATGSSGVTSVNPLVDAEYTALVGSTLMSAKTYQHDANGNVTQVTDYDWFDSSSVTRDSVGVPTAPLAGATVLRVANTSYYNPAPDANSANYYATRSLTSGVLSILNASKETTVGPSITQLSYDLQAYGTAPTIGNLTSQRTWDDVDNKWITSSQTYGQYGNLETKTDPRQKTTYFFYDDPTHALPTRVVVDPQNSSGQQTTATVFDYSTGLVTSQTDPNNNTATISYTNQLLGTVDPFGRPGVTTAPAVDGQNRETKTYYADSARTVTVISDLNSANDELLKNEAVSDMLGRTVETRQYETANNFIAVRQTYDTANRIQKTSNPFRAGETILWTTAVSDVFGRVTSVTTPDNAAVSTSYSANTVTVADQTGKQRKSVSDGLGRLIQVYEDPNSLNYLTSYAYDVFGNLHTVSQGSQTRTFNYDSLSRLRSAVNPESGTISYAYDDSGNLTQRTDARGVVSGYVYDGLNRNTSVSYTNDPAGTAAVNRYYDGWRDNSSHNIPNSVGRLWQTETAGSAGSRTTINGFDALGRPTSESQQFYASGAWAQAYTVQRSYNLAGGVTSQTYPSGRVVNYNYDHAGRLADDGTTNPAFSGNLGDGGAPRTYSSGIVYSALGGMIREQFGTTTPINNKLFYNSRGQLAEIRESTSYTGATDTTWNRGAIINDYSSSCWGMCGGSSSNTAMTDNNGNLKKQEVYVPGDEQLQNAPYTTWYDQFDYDSLNRLQRVHEYTGNTSLDWQQEYFFDRYGNRTIQQDVTKTWGSGINKKDFTVNTANNRLGVPSGQTGTMTYDPAGNLTTDTYSGAAVTRAYDAENRMSSETQGSSYLAGVYTYNADGQRVRRKLDNAETWQVYGLDGELLAEYAANATAASPQKEYGYRNGQLLITADAPTRTNVALASNGGTASASSVYSPSQGTGYSAVPADAINGDRTGKVGSATAFWNDGTQNSGPDWLQVDFNGSKSIDEVDVFTAQDNYTSPSAPTETMTFSQYGLTSYDAQYWDGSAWTTVTGGSITGNNKVWKKITFTAVTTTKIRVLANASIDGWSRVAEVEAWGNAAPTNVALASNGATASASSTYSPSSGTGYSAVPAETINGDRSGKVGSSTSFWNDGTQNSGPDWLQVDFNGSKSIGEIDVFTAQDNYTSPSAPTETMTFSLYGLTGYDVQYWDGSAWVTVTGGSVTGNNKVWRKLTFTAITTTKIRVLANATADGWSRITEVEAWTASSGSSANINWLVTDQLGTPRMIFDQSGSLATTKRHDYLPFGEELAAGQGVRYATPGYGSTDGVRQKFTQKERDIETGLDYFLARYYSSTQGRFTGVDPVLITKKRLFDPQELNLYAYTRNSPLCFIDPDGEYFVGTDDKTVDVTVKNGKITLSQNASKDLSRIASLISASGSKKALEMFTKVASNVTKVNFSISPDEGKDAQGNTLNGLHQAHDNNGNALTWVADNNGTGHFDGTVAFVKDAKGNVAYEEATITVYEGSLKMGGAAQKDVEDGMVSVMSHEEEHDTDRKAIKAIKDRQEGRTNNFDVERPAYKVQGQVTREISKNRKKRP